MGRVMPYQGTYVSAKSASELLDIDAILRGCDHVDQNSSKIREYTSNIKDSTSTLDSQNFSIDNQTVQPMINDYCSSLTEVEDSILSSTASIRSTAEAKYNQLQEQLNHEAEQKDKYYREFNQKNK